MLKAEWKAELFTMWSKGETLYSMKQYLCSKMPKRERIAYGLNTSKEVKDYLEFATPSWCK